MNKPFFSVIIPLRRINDYLIKENLPALDKQVYKHFEAIVLPNKKSPEDFALLKKYKWLRIIPTGKITRPAQKRDMGVQKAKGTIAAFIDDDAYVTEHWLERALKVFDKKNAEAVCGPGILPPSAVMWEKVFDEILKTYIGSGGFGYRFTRKNAKPRFVDDYPSMNFLIKKDVFVRLGGFDSDYWPGEDSKLCEDLVYKYKGTIYYDPSVFIYHHRRTDPAGYLRQHGQYGYHRGAFFAHGDKNSRRLTYLIPSFFVLYLIAALALCFWSRVTYQFLIAPLIMYSVLLLFQFLSACKNTRNLKIGLLSSIVLFLMHAVYGLQFMRGFTVGVLKKEKIY